ncbi:MAG TPA: beta-propeller fold lactonase family protein [Gemmatimonadaceae bacterium]|nr:beta-propeller fold lactonase family protein [Gemmatimonadaceae bacterium]
MSIIAGSHLRSLTRLSSLVGIAALAACSDQTTANLIAPDQAVESRGTGEFHGSDDGAVFVTTNGANGNEVKAFSRAADGSLSPLGTFATGGTGVGGVGDPLTSQGAAALSPDHKLLFVVNAGSNDVSVFRIQKDGLNLVDRESSGGLFPNSVAATDDAVYVLNGNSSSVGIFDYNESGNLHSRGTASLSPNTAGPTEVRVSPNGRWLDVTERASNTIDAFRIGADGGLSAPVKSVSAGQTPFGFQFTPKGLVVVSEAGSTSASSYDQARGGTLTPVSSAVSNGGQAAPCWLIVDPRGRFAYTANAGGSSISGFAIGNDGKLTLLTPDGRTGDLGTGAQPLDIDFGGDGRFLYVLKNGTGTIGAFAVNTNGTLIPLADTPGLIANAGFMGLVAF